MTKRKLSKRCCFRQKHVPSGRVRSGISALVSPPPPQTDRRLTSPSEIHFIFCNNLLFWTCCCPTLILCLSCIYVLYWVINLENWLTAVLGSPGGPIGPENHSRRYRSLWRGEAGTVSSVHLHDRVINKLRAVNTLRGGVIGIFWSQVVKWQSFNDNPVPWRGVYMRSEDKCSKVLGTHCCRVICCAWPILMGDH